MTHDEATDPAEGPTTPAEMERRVAAGDDPGFEHLEAQLRALPWWRRPRKLRRQLSRTLVFVAFLSVLLVGGLNFFAARQLLDNGTEEQLVGTGETRARSIERGVSRQLETVAAIAGDLSVVSALDDLAAAFPGAGTLDDDQRAELDDFYLERVVTPLGDLDIADVTVEQVEPASDAGRYLQYHYTVADADVDRSAVDDAGDGSIYSDQHAVHHPYLASLADTLLFDDLLLVSAENGEIVYSTEKRIDFGTSLVDGPYRDSTLADTVLDELRRVPAGDAVLADFEIFVPGGGEPVAFVAAAVRDDTELVGAVVAQISVDRLNQITTAGERWEAVGLDTGESYVVGSDGLLRSESRLWIEDPEAYLDRVDADLADRIEAIGSPVLVQPVETAPVAAALDGDDFRGRADNYLGESSLSFATPIEVTGVDWVVVADVPLSEARAPLYTYFWRMLLIVVIIVPIAALLGAWLAKRSTRPVWPVVNAATAVAAGERDPDLPSLGRDEFGDLGRRLKRMAHDLGEQEQHLLDEYEDTRRLLLTVLPPRLVDDDGVVAGSGEAAELATAIAIGFTIAAGQDVDEELDEQLGRINALIDEDAHEQGVERVRAAADRSLFVVGIGRDADGADEALAFAGDVRRHVDELAENDAIDIGLHIGVSTGPIGVGVLRRGTMTFGAWGEPVRRALAIAALSATDDVLVDVGTYSSSTTERFTLEPATDVVTLDAEPMGLHRLVMATPDSTEPV